MKAKTSTERVAASDARHRYAGHVQRKVWATPEEHVWLKEQLDDKRRRDIRQHRKDEAEIGQI